MTSFIQEVEFISATITFFLRVINLIYGLFDKGYFATIALGGGTFDCTDARHYSKRMEKGGAFSIFDRISANDN